MRKTPQIPRDVFFGGAASDQPDAVTPAPQAEPEPVALPPAPVPVADDDKVQVTVYLSPVVAKRLEALRFHLLNDHNVKVSKSAIAEYGISHLGDDLEALARHFRMGER